MQGIDDRGAIPFYPGMGDSLTRLEAMSTKEQMQNAGSEFEGLFLSLMLKEMRGTLGEEGGLFGGDGGDVYGGLFDLMIGQSLAASSPLGIAGMVKNYLGKVAELTLEAAAQRTAEEGETTAPAVDLPL